ncbi:MAG: hypothetical protein Q4C50_03945 [Eubacteriales bacterium]|nr:hypothetical protein [Eubacteriales bacterium]
MEQRGKNLVRNILGCLLLCLMVTFCIPAIHSEAAAKKPTCPKKQTVYFADYGGGWGEPTGYSRNIFIKNLASNAKITNVKCSNKNVFLINRGKYISVGDSKLKSGSKAKVTFKVKQNKKTYSLSCTLTFKKNTCDFSSLKIGGKNYASKTTGKLNVQLKLPYKKSAISVKMKSGRKLTSIKIYRGQKVIKVKNGSKAALKKGDIIMIGYKYTKKPSSMPKNLKVTETGAVRIIVK